MVGKGKVEKMMEKTKRGMKHGGNLWPCDIHVFHIFFTKAESVPVTSYPLL